MMRKDAICFTGGKVLREGQWKNESLFIAEGKIVTERLAHEIDISGLLIAPGYIDLQVNGAFGIDFTTQQTLINPKMLAPYGVTHFLPTLISPAKVQIRGAHIEGPLLHFTGAHPKQTQVPDLTQAKMVTLAPELPEAKKLIPLLKAKGILIAAGHSNATYDEILESGVLVITHLFNAMRPFHHREPGIIGAALANSEIAFSIIADGVHVHPAAIKMAWQANKKGFFLVSDTMSGLGMPTGTYSLAGQEVKVTDRAQIGSVLAGSIVALDQAVRNLYNWTGCSLIEAIQAASLKPAQLLGLQNKGSLHIGADADLVLLDEELNVHATYIAGELFFKKQQ